MNPVTGATLNAFYVVGDWKGFANLMWTPTAQPSGSLPYYRISYHDIPSNTWIWLKDVTDEEGTIYGIAVQFASAPSGGGPKTITVDQIRIVTKDINGTADSTAVTINTPTTLTENHVVPTGFAVICSGLFTDSEGAIDMTWTDATMFMSHGLITLTKYGTSSPGIQRTLYSGTFSAMPSIYGPNRVRIPINLFPGSVPLQQSLTDPGEVAWDINNPPIDDPGAAFLVVEGDILTFTITTYADGDTVPITAEYSFAYYHEVTLVPLVATAILSINNIIPLTVQQYPNYPYPIAAQNISYISGLPSGMSYDAFNMNITGSPTTLGVYNPLFKILSSGGFAYYQTVQVTVTRSLDMPSGSTWPEIVQPPANVTILRGVDYPTDLWVWGPGGAGGYLISAGTMPDGLTFNTGTGAITGAPTTNGTYPVTFQQHGVLYLGPAYTVTFTVVDPEPPNITAVNPPTPPPYNNIGTCTFGPANEVGFNPLTSIHSGDIIYFTPGTGSLPSPLVYGPDKKYTVNTVIPADNAFTINDNQGGGAVNFPAASGVAANLWSNRPLNQPPNIGDSIVTNLYQVLAYIVKADSVCDSFRAQGLPQGLFMDGAVITGIPTDLPGPYIAYVQGHNQWGWGPQFVLAITLQVPVPVIASAAASTVLVGQPFSYQIVASNNPIFYGADGLPAGLFLNTETGLISGVPTEVGASAVTITAVNVGGAATGALALTVGLPPVPVIDTSALTGRAITLQVNEAFVFQPSASNNPTSWSAEPLADGLIFDTATGSLSGAFLANGIYSIIFVATNAGGNSVPVTFYFMVGVVQGGGTPGPNTPVPLDVVNLWIELDTSLVSVNNPVTSQTAATVKRGDTAVVTVIFHRETVPTDINLTALYFGAKVDFDDDYIIFSNVWRRLGVGTYRVYPDFSDENNALDKILSGTQVTLIGEIQWDVDDGTRRSTPTFDVVVLRDLLHPDPTLLPPGP